MGESKIIRHNGLAKVCRNFVFFVSIFEYYYVAAMCFVVNTVENVGQINDTPIGFHERISNRLLERKKRAINYGVVFFFF